MQYINDFIKRSFDKRYIAHCHESIKKSLKKIIEPNKDILIMIGPEGDFSKEEIKLAEKAGFKSINLKFDLGQKQQQLLLVIQFTCNE